MSNKTPVKAVIDVVNIDKFKSFSIPVIDQNSSYLGKKVGNILASLTPLRRSRSIISITCDDYGATLRPDGQVDYDPSQAVSWRDKIEEEIADLVLSQREREAEGKHRSKHIQIRISTLRAEQELYRDIWM